MLRVCGVCRRVITELDVLIPTKIHSLIDALYFALTGLARLASISFSARSVGTDTRMVSSFLMYVSHYLRLSEFALTLDMMLVTLPYFLI